VDVGITSSSWFFGKELFDRKRSGLQVRTFVATLQCLKFRKTKAKLTKSDHCQGLHASHRVQAPSRVQVRQFELRVEVMIVLVQPSIEPIGIAILFVFSN